MNYDQHLAQQFQSLAPPTAVQITLVGDLDAGSTQRYPTEGFYDLWSSDGIPVPNGRYMLGYYNHREKHLKTPGPVYIQVHRPGNPYANQAASSAATALVPAAEPRGATPALLPEHQRELSAVETSLRATTAEFQKHKMALAMQRDAQKLALGSAVLKEVQAAAAVNTTYRLELQAMAETHSNLTRRHVEHSAKQMEVLGTMTEMAGTVVANLQKAASSMVHPPPQPVDYSDTILKGLGMVGGLALNAIAMMKGLPPVKSPRSLLDPGAEDAIEAGLMDKPRAPGTADAEKPAPAGEPPSKPSTPSAPTAAPTTPTQTSAADAGLPVAASAAKSDVPAGRKNAPQAAVFSMWGEPSVPSAGTSVSAVPAAPAALPAASAASAAPATPAVSAASAAPAAPAAVAAPAAPAAVAAPATPAATVAPAVQTAASRKATLPSLVDQFMEGGTGTSQALPVPEKSDALSGADYFVTTGSGDDLELLTRLLKKLPDRIELEKLVALVAPHLHKRLP